MDEVVIGLLSLSVGLGWAELPEQEKDEEGRAKHRPPAPWCHGTLVLSLEKTRALLELQNGTGGKEQKEPEKYVQLRVNETCLSLLGTKQHGRLRS